MVYSSSIQNAGKGSEMDVGFKNFFNTLYYGQDFTLHDWEESFKHVAHTTDSGYVAMIQKMLVVEAQCVVFIGGGSFQKHAQTLYVHSHHKKESLRNVHKQVICILHHHDMFFLILRMSNRALALSPELIDNIYNYIIILLLYNNIIHTISLAEPVGFCSCVQRLKTW